MLIRAEQRLLSSFLQKVQVFSTEIWDILQHSRRVVCPPLPLLLVLFHEFLQLLQKGQLSLTSSLVAALHGSYAD